eukprot:6316184-Pyramimonas_sp.AAC.1
MCVARMFIVFNALLVTGLLCQVEATQYSKNLPPQQMNYGRNYSYEEGEEVDSEAFEVWYNERLGALQDFLQEKKANGGIRMCLLKRHSTQKSMTSVERDFVNAAKIQGFEIEVIRVRTFVPI